MMMFKRCIGNSVESGERICPFHLQILLKKIAAYDIRIWCSKHLLVINVEDLLKAFKELREKN